MTLTAKTLGYLSLVFVLLMTSVIIGTSVLLLHQFSQLEQHRFQRDIDRVQNIFTDGIAQLEKSDTDWASWDDTYQFIADNNRQYIQSNLDTDTLSNLRINLIAYINMQGTIVEARGVSARDHHKTLVSPTMLQGIRSCHFSKIITKSTLKMSGVLTTANGPMIFSACPILRTGNKGRVRGVLLMARNVDEDFVNTIVRLTNERIGIVPLNSSAIPRQVKAWSRRTSQSRWDSIIHISNARDIDGFLLVKDIQGTPAALLKVSQTRETYKQGIASIRYTGLAVLLVSAISLLLMVTFLTRHVLSRIRYLDSETQRIRSSGDTHARINLLPNRAVDEIDRLAYAINAMLGSLETSQRHAAANLTASERQLRSILETAPEGIAVIDVISGRIRLANHALADILQTSVERLVDAPFDEYPCIDPSLFGAHINQARASGQPFTFEAGCQSHAEQGGVLFEVSGTLFNYREREAVLVFIRNITQQRIAAQRLASINECIVHFGPQSTENITRLTELCGAMLQADCAAYLRVQSQSVVTISRWQTPADFPAEMPLTHSIFREVMASPQQQAYLLSGVFTFPTPDGGIREDDRWQSFVCHPILVKQELVGFLGLWYQQQTAPAEDLLQALTTMALAISSEEERQETLTALEIANKAKSDFLANMSHELRTPLNAIIGYSEMLQEESEDLGYEDLLPDLRKITSAGRHLLALISDILDLSKIEAGKVQLHIESFELQPLLQDIVATFQPIMQKNQNVLTVSVSDNLGSMESDLTKVRQILFNLLSNAAKFTEHADVTLSAHREEREDGDSIVLCVRDGGIGMSPEQIAKLFRPFTQADSSTTRKYGGTGLGLTITRHFCEMLHGEISVESEPGRGSTFTVSLPVNHAADETVTPSTQRTIEPAGLRHAELQQKTVLVIDDDPGVQDMLQRMLVKDGYKVFVAGNGLEGIESARRHHPAIITLDVMMPEMDGWSTLALLKTDPQLADIPVIMLTILDDKQQIGFALGASEYLVKPIIRERLLNVLERYSPAVGTPSLLVIDDDVSMQQLMRWHIEKEGWTVATADNGIAGLAALQTAKPNLILLDLMMPEMDGFAFIDELLSHPEWQDIPIIAITAKSLTADEKSRLNTAVAAIIEKAQFDHDGLIAVINTIVHPVKRNSTLREEVMR